MQSDLVSGTKNARYSPGEVIEMLELMVNTLDQITGSCTRWWWLTHKDARVSAQSKKTFLSSTALASTTPNLFRAALFYSIYEQTGEPAAATQSLAGLSKGRDAWANMGRASRKNLQHRYQLWAMFPFDEALGRSAS